MLLRCAPGPLHSTKELDRAGVSLLLPLLIGSIILQRLHSPGTCMPGLWPPTGPASLAHGALSGNEGPPPAASWVPSGLQRLVPHCWGRACCPYPVPQGSESRRCPWHGGNPKELSAGTLVAPASCLGAWQSPAPAAYLQSPPSHEGKALLCWSQGLRATTDLTLPSFPGVCLEHTCL